MARKKQHIHDVTDTKKDSDGIGFVKKPLGGEEHADRKQTEKDEEAKKDDALVDTTVMKKIDTQLAEIYKEKDGSLPDMTHFEKKRRSSLLRAFFFLLFSCALLGVVAWVGFFVLSPSSGFSQEDIIFSISGQEEVVVGSEVSYRIRYRNDQGIRLNRVVVEVRYPVGFVFQDSSRVTVPGESNRWELESLGPGESGFIDVHGALFGDTDQEQSFRAFLSYTPENFSSEFQSVATANVKTTHPPAILSIEAPKEVILGAEVPITLVVSPPEGEAVENLAVVIEPGTGFLPKKSEPKADQFDEHRWTLGSLTGEKKIVVHGAFLPDTTGDLKEVRFRLIGWPPGKESSETQFTYDTQVYAPMLLTTEVSARAVINGASETLAARPGETLHTSIVVQNNGQASLKNVRVRILLDAPSHAQKSILDWATLEDIADGTVVGEQINEDTRRGSITWSSKEIPELAVVAPQTRKEILFRLPIKSSEEVTLSDFKTHTITGHIEMIYQTEGETEPQVFSSQPIIITINSDFDFEVRDDVSRGAVGPEQHTVTWIVSNTFHEIEDIRVSAIVYGRASIATSSFVLPAGAASYDEGEQKITWTVERMPLSVDVLPFRFAVVRADQNPSQTQLMSKVEIRARDSITQEEIILVGDEILLSP